jgi:hypothetical protein
MKYISKTTRLAALLIAGTFIAVNGFAQTSLTSGQVAYFPFNGNANDASGNGYNGTIYGGVTPTTDRFGNPNAAYAFDGSTGYIDISQNSTLNVLTTNVTVSAWIRQGAAIPNGYSIISKSNTKVGNGWMFDTYSCSTSSGRRLRLQTGGNNNSCNVPGSTDYSLMQWHHVVATISGTSGYVYLDGNLDGSGNVGIIPTNTLDVFIGYTHVTQGADATAWFNGAIDDVRIYNRALSAGEVQQLYAYESQPSVALIKAVKPSFSNLYLGTNYQLQVSTDLVNWTNSGSFTATNSSMVSTQYFDVPNWNQLFFRLH